MTNNPIQLDRTIIVGTPKGYTRLSVSVRPTGTGFRKAPLLSPRLFEQFWENLVQTEDGCWEWQGKIDGGGYGRIGTNVLVHRASYFNLVTPFDLDLDIDHLCRNTRCANPGHLEPVPHIINCWRGKQAQQTHCKHGHSFAPEAGYLVVRVRRDGSTYRQCRECCRRNASPANRT